MKKIWKIIIITIFCLMTLIRIIDIFRVAWCQVPWLKIKTSCGYDNNHSIYKEIGLWYEYIEDSYDKGIGWIVGKILWIKACDIPAWNLTSCTEDKTVVEIINPIIQDALSEMNILKTWNNSYYNKDLNQVEKLTIYLPKNSIKELDLSELKSLESLKRLIIAWKYEFKQTRDWSRESQWSVNWDWFVNIKWLEQLSWVTSLLMHDFPLETLDWKILPPNLKSFEFSAMGLNNLDNECDLLKIKSINIVIDWTFYDNSNLCNDKLKCEEDNNPDNGIDWFTWNIINWSHRETFIITWDNTLYYNDEFWFAIKLWKERNWAKIEIWKWCEECTETEYPHHIMINLLKPKVKEDWPMDWYSTISFSVVTKLEYEKMLELTKWDPMCEWDCIKDNTIWHNNHYYFLLGYTNQAPEDIINLFQWQLECDLIYPKWEEWTSSELWDCTYALKKISSNYHFYNIMSDVPTILDD